MAMHPFATLLGGLALCAATTLADTATVYKTVDEQGNVSFSDSPPAPGASAQTLHYPTADPSDSDTYRQRLEDMRDTTDRMAADRREREQQRAEQRRELAATDRGPADDTYPGYAGDYYSGGYPVYLGPVRPPHHHRPPHFPPTYPPLHPDRPWPRPPLARPPAQGVEGLRSNLRNNSQLMRPMLPRRGQ
ncbi:DUF4124 domain-containing protein [Parahaliea mediterranea]|uniref:DUF4124 domain-containing protein n=1 Tax=Parahaliea mediterranea TaxID=651086 RepID=UPI001F4EDCEA|nr:DUF4124 domain-containing protein [Parahaliea mediterranea]